nr:hypothetical protein CFP56_18437 [Quercus suber]
MEATNSSIGSYAWHSIFKGHDVLLNGARWRVGSGESVGVWLDSWLPSCKHPRVLSPMVDGFEEARVADLIDSVSRQWDSILLQERPFSISDSKTLVCGGKWNSNLEISSEARY